MGAAVQPLRFTRLLVRNWRNFTHGYAELRRRAFVAGPAAAGKSNLLDAFRFLREIASAPGGLQEAVRRRGGVRKLRCLAARQESHVGVMVHVGNDLEPAEWEYGIEMAQDKRGQPLIQKERLRRRGEPVIERPDEEDQADPERLARSVLEGGVHPRQVREYAAFLRSIRLVNLSPAVIREPGAATAAAGEELGAFLLESMAATPDKSRNARLRLILEELRAAVPRISSLESHRDSLGRAHLRALFEQWRPRGAWQSETQIADGVLRLTGILWEALSAAGPLLVEEPETSLHEAVVRLIPSMLARLGRRTGRQIILTTHAPALLEGAGVTTNEIILLCPEREVSSWRPPVDAAEAACLLRDGRLNIEAPPPPDEHQLALFGEMDG